MLISIGLQNKILQAMIMKIPCVISPMANNALGAMHGKHLLVAETPAQYSEFISALLGDTAMAAEIAENGYQFIRDNFSWEHHTGVISKKLSALLHTH